MNLQLTNHRHYSDKPLIFQDKIEVADVQNHSSKRCGYLAFKKHQSLRCVRKDSSSIAIPDFFISIEGSLVIFIDYTAKESTQTKSSNPLFLCVCSCLFRVCIKDAEIFRKLSSQQWKLLDIAVITHIELQWSTA